MASQMSSTSVTYDIHGNSVLAPPTLPDGWESTWEELIGSPRFEEARQINGATLDDLRAATGPINPGLEEAVVRALEERREKRRLYELRCVMEERQKKVDSSSESEQDKTDWAQKMKDQNKARIELLKEQAIKANQVQQRRTCFELAKALALETRAQNMAEDSNAAELKRKQREEQRQKEVAAVQLEKKQQRIQMEAEKAQALQFQEEALVRKLYSYKQQEEAREAVQRRKLEELQAIAKHRESARRAAQHHHREKQKQMLEDQRQQTLRTFEIKESRTTQWKLSQIKHHAEALKESRKAESGVGKRLAEAMDKQAAVQAENLRRAEEREIAAEERQRRIDQQKHEALFAKRQLTRARSERNTTLLRSIREGEEHMKLGLKSRALSQDMFVQQQKQRLQKDNENRKLLNAAREAEKQHCVERTRRASEHALVRRVEHFNGMAERAEGLQRERRMLIEQRARSAKQIALQRANVQEQFKQARSVGDLKKSSGMLADIGIDLKTLKEMSETILNEASPQKGSRAGGEPATPQSAPAKSAAPRHESPGQPGDQPALA